jgi:hypothetical protein
MWLVSAAGCPAVGWTRCAIQYETYRISGSHSGAASPKTWTYTRRRPSVCLSIRDSHKLSGNRQRLHILPMRCAESNTFEDSPQDGGCPLTCDIQSCLSGCGRNRWESATKQHTQTAAIRMMTASSAERIRQEERGRGVARGDDSRHR